MDMNMHSDWLFPSLPRPQYPPFPDVLQSSLAWELVNRRQTNEGLVLQRTSSCRGSGSDFAVRATSPYAGEDGQQSAHGLLAPDERSRVWDSMARKVLNTDQPRAGRALIRSLQGVSGRGSTSVAMSPLTPSLARMQDAAGTMGTDGPPDFAGIFRALFSVGGPPGQDAVGLWDQAMSVRIATFPILGAIDGSAAAVLEGLWDALDPAEAPAISPAPEWLRQQRDTPYAWFNESWRCLCTEWPRVLPPRRWTDWTSAVLRMALGFGYLWEARFFWVLACHTIRCNQPGADRDASWASCHRQLFLGAPPLLPWQQPGGSIHQTMNDLITKGHACMKFMHEALADASRPAGTSLREAFDHVASLVGRLPQGSMDRLRRAASGAEEASGLKNFRETIRYALMARDPGDGMVDHYGFLRAVRSEELRVRPSGEWITLMAALASGGPTHPCRLDDVQQSIARLGLRPRIDVLQQELERAGLTEGSPDGDGGVRVHVPFATEVAR